MAPQTKPTRQATRTLQTLRGTGKVYAGETFVCHVRYSVTVHQGIVYAGFQPSTGVKDIRGTLNAMEGVPSLKLGSRLSLHMEDGRKATFVVSSSSSIPGMYGIQVSALRDQ